MKNLFLYLLLITLGAFACNKNEHLYEGFSQEEMKLLINRLTTESIVVTSVETGEISLDEWSIIQERLDQGKELEDAVSVLTNQSLKKRVLAYFIDIEEYCKENEVDMNMILEEYKVVENNSGINSASRSSGSDEQRCYDDYYACLASAQVIAISSMAGTGGNIIGAGVNFTVSKAACTLALQKCLSFCRNNE